VVACNTPTRILLEFLKKYSKLFVLKIPEKDTKKKIFFRNIRTNSFGYFLKIPTDYELGC